MPKIVIHDGRPIAQVTIQMLVDDSTFNLPHLTLAIKDALHKFSDDFPGVDIGPVEKSRFDKISNPDSSAPAKKQYTQIGHIDLHDKRDLPRYRLTVMSHADSPGQGDCDLDVLAAIASDIEDGTYYFQATATPYTDTDETGFPEIENYDEEKARWLTANAITDGILNKISYIEGQVEKLLERQVEVGSDLGTQRRAIESIRTSYRGHIQSNYLEITKVKKDVDSLTDRHQRLIEADKLSNGKIKRLKKWLKGHLPNAKRMLEAADIIEWIEGYQDRIREKDEAFLKDSQLVREAIDGVKDQVRETIEGVNELGHEVKRHARIINDYMMGKDQS